MQLVPLLLNGAASFRPTSPPQWGEAPGAERSGSIREESSVASWDNAAAKHFLRDAPLMDHLSRQTEELAMALEVVAVYKLNPVETHSA
jgi:hypothetical protein